jgi:hypothetical protein
MDDFIAMLFIKQKYFLHRNVMLLFQLCFNIEVQILIFIFVVVYGDNCMSAGDLCSSISACSTAVVKAKAKFPCALTEHHAMEVYWGVKV